MGHEIDEQIHVDVEKRDEQELYIITQDVLDIKYFTVKFIRSDRQLELYFFLRKYLTPECTLLTCEFSITK